MAANKRPPKRRKKIEVSKATKRRKGLRCIKQPTFLHLCEACAALSPAFAIRTVRRCHDPKTKCLYFGGGRTYLQKHLGLKLAAVPKAVSIECWWMLSSRDNKELMDLRGSFCHPCKPGFTAHDTYWHLTTAAGLQNGTCQAIINPQRLSNWSLVHRIVTKASLETCIRQAWGP